MPSEESNGVEEKEEASEPTTKEKVSDETPNVSPSDELVVDSSDNQDVAVGTESIQEDYHTIVTETNGDAEGDESALPPRSSDDMFDDFGGGWNETYHEESDQATELVSHEDLPVDNRDFGLEPPGHSLPNVNSDEGLMGPPNGNNHDALDDEVPEIGHPDEGGDAQHSETAPSEETQDVRLEEHLLETSHTDAPMEHAT